MSDRMELSATENNNKQKILVIGGNGFLGSYIVRKCMKEGLLVTATYRTQLNPYLIKSLGPEVKWISLDIQKLFDLEEAMEGMDFVINCAAMVSFDPAQKKEVLRVGKEGTANIVHAAIEKGIQKLVHVSSVAALGRKKPENHISEKEVFSHSKYDTNYGLSKFLAEQEVWRAHFEGLPVTIINPSMVIGAGPWGQSSTSLFTSIYDGLKYYPIGSTGFVDVRDVADAAFLALSRKVDGERFIISAENLSFEVVFKGIAQSLGQKQTLTPLTPFFSALAWRWARLVSLFSGKSPFITRDNVKSTGTISWYYHSKSVEFLGMNYRMIKNSIEETGTKFIEAKRTESSFDMLD